MKKLLIAGLVTAVVGAGLYWVYARSQNTAQKPLHFVDSTPMAEQRLPASPVAVVLNFETDLASIKSFTLRPDGASDASASVSTGQPTIDDLATTARLPINQPLPDGNYQTDFTVCFTDTTCTSGAVQFAVDSNLLSEFSDQRGKKEVTVELDRIAFNQPKILVSPGTTVIWRNAEDVEHYVNTETHPYHTYVLDHNSRALTQNEEYRHTFTQPGAYPYHCSAHAAVMTGMIVVDD